MMRWSLNGALIGLQQFLIKHNLNFNHKSIDFDALFIYFD